jgi:multiple sugar transport system substrate-binding protein
MSKKAGLILFLTFTLMALAAGCGDGGKGNPVNPPEASSAPSQTAPPQDSIANPVTLTMFSPWTEDQFQQFVTQPVAKKFPQVTIKRLTPPGTGPQAIANSIAAGEIPDLIYILPGWYTKLLPMGVFSDLTPLIQKDRFDMNRLLPGAVDMTKVYSGNGKVLFIPFSMTTTVLYYNKDIFDKFGVPYPKDKMTYDELTSKISQLAKLEAGTQYRAYITEMQMYTGFNQLSLPFVDPKTNKALIDSEGWKGMLSLVKGLYDADIARPKDEIGMSNPMFADKKILSMDLGRLEFASTLASAKYKDLNWDMASMPVHPQMPNTGLQVNAPSLVITPNSKHKDEAFQVIAYLLSDEVQRDNNKNGMLTVLKDPAIRNSYGANIELLNGKNMKAALLLEPAKPSAFTVYDTYAVNGITAAMKQVITGKKDINTALREQKEVVDKEIQENLVGAP